MSTLVGIAIEQGRIHSVNDPITRYHPELARRDTRFDCITIKDLLRMTSGLRYVEKAPPHDNQRTYMNADVRTAALEATAIIEAAGTHWLCNNYNPLLLGIVLERVTGRSVTDLLEAGIWGPL